MQAAPDTSPAWRAVFFSAVCVLAKGEKKKVWVWWVGWAPAPFGEESKAVSKEKKKTITTTIIHTQTTHGVR